MTWIGSIQIRKDTTEDVTKVCEDIANKDESFQWKIENGKLLITHNDKNIMYKKLIWMLNKVEVLKGCKFMVKYVK